MSAAQILIAGIGNIFLGDDGFGVAVAQELARRPLPQGVRVVDFGIRGLDLTYALLDPHEAVILVDATPRGGLPGTIYVLEPDVSGPFAPSEQNVFVDMHNLNPARVLRLAAALGSPVRRVLLVGCEPSVETGDCSSGLSAPVQQAVGEAVALVESLVSTLQCGEIGSGRAEAQ